MGAEELMAAARGAAGRGRLADGALAAFVVLLVGMMVVPLPTALLDVLLASNVAVAVLVLLVALHLGDALAFSAFPTLLLVTTLYRLALNVSSTRLILLQADAGEVIRAFGEFVVRGNYVVGAIVFLLITLVQFVVIARGSERVAEVAARFALDAMPGKQMSIDAELRSGAIGQEEARRRRRHLQRESELYGAMDGAMKFVKGDAIAGIVITLVNVGGGLAVGVGQRDLSLSDSLAVYGLLTIGDGLVSQIPALLVSTAAGIVVTRVASEDGATSLGTDVGRQVFGDVRSLRIAAGFLALLGLVPGLPWVPFLVLAALFLAAALAATPRAGADDTPVRAAARKESDRETRARQEQVPVVAPVAIDLGLELARRLVDAQGGGALLDRELPDVREALFRDLGVPLPGVRVRAADALPDDAFVVSVQEIPAEAGRVEADVDVEAASGAVAAALARVARRRAADLVGLQETQSLLDQLERVYPALVRHVVPKPVSLPLLADVLRRLVDEGVSIRPLREVLEALAVHAPHERDPGELTEHVRRGLSRALAHRHMANGALPVLLLASELVETLRDAVEPPQPGDAPGTLGLALAPSLAREIVAAVRQEAASAAPAGLAPPVVLVPPDLRRGVRRLLAVELPDLAVLGFTEVPPEVRIEPAGEVDLAPGREPGVRLAGPKP